MLPVRNDSEPTVDSLHNRPRHVLYGNDNLQIDCWRHMRIDYAHRAITAEEARDFFRRARGRRETDPLRIRIRERRQTLERQSEVRSALRCRHRMYLVYDYEFDRT